MILRINKGNSKDGGFIVAGNVHITRREITALAFTGEGFDNESGAEKFGVNINTFRNHVFNAVRKLGAKNRAQAIVLAIHNRLISIENDNGTEGKEIYNFYVCENCHRVYETEELLDIGREQFIVNHIKWEGQQMYACPYEDCGKEIGFRIPWKEILPQLPEENVIPKRSVKYNFSVYEWFLNRYRE